MRLHLIVSSVLILSAAQLVVWLIPYLFGEHFECKYPSLIIQYSFFLNENYLFHIQEMNTKIW